MPGIGHADLPGALEALDGVTHCVFGNTDGGRHRVGRLTLSYKRQRNMLRMFPYDCDENDRNPVVDGKIGIRQP